MIIRVWLAIKKKRSSESACCHDNKLQTYSTVVTMSCGQGLIKTYLKCTDVQDELVHKSVSSAGSKRGVFLCVNKDLSQRLSRRQSQGFFQCHYIRRVVGILLKQSSNFAVQQPNLTSVARFPVYLCI